MNCLGVFVCVMWYIIAVLVGMAMECFARNFVCCIKETVDKCVDKLWISFRNVLGKPVCTIAHVQRFRYAL
jgi:hypothetical protein